MKMTKFMAIAVVTAIAGFSGSAIAASDAPKAWNKCKGCHSVEAGKNSSGPSLAGIIGRQAGTVDGFKRYKAMKGAKFTWTEENLDAWITNSKKFLKANADIVGGKRSAMNVKIKKEKDRKAIIAYLKSAS